ncbi:MAG: hypothetical protein AAF449_04950, partial [Myxococcota bacterium]
AYGQPIPFDLEGMTITVPSPGMYIDYRRPNQISATRVYVATGVLTLNLKGVVEVLLTSQSALGYHVHHIDAAVRVR